MARIPDQIIEQVREAHDIVEVVGRAVQLKKAGAGYKGLCPFHGEKTPSFTVHSGRQTYMCFGCQKGGNVLTFVMETQGLSFPEAVRQLAAERGIDVPDNGRHDPEMDARMAALRSALKVAHRYFVASLKADVGYEARAYLEKRGYDAAAIDDFGLGYAPESWDGLREAARKAGVSDRALLDAGLVRPRQNSDGVYDYFRHRVMFPIADGQGRLVTFAGRALAADEPAKYMNGPETDVFKKSTVLYHLHRAREHIRRKDEALLMEGYTDVLMCHLHGFGHAVAGMGTAFTQRQAGLLRRHADRVTLLYDSDSAGRQAAAKALPLLLEEGLEVRVALLPEGRDVDEILLEDGPQALDTILANALDMLTFKLKLLGERYDLDSPRGRAKASEDLVALVKHIRSHVERDQWVTAIADRLGGGASSEKILRREAARHLRPPRPLPTARAASPSQAASSPASGQQIPVPMPPFSHQGPQEGALEEAPPYDGPGFDGPPADGSPHDSPSYVGEAEAEHGIDGPEGVEDHTPLPPEEGPRPLPERPRSRLEQAQDGLFREQRALDEQDLLSAVLFDQELLGRIFRAVGPEEFTSPARSRLYEALLGSWEEGHPVTFKVAMTRFQADQAVAALLARLSEDETLAERVTCQIDHMERKRARVQHLRKVVRIAGGGQNAGSDPDDSYYGDDVVLDGESDAPALEGGSSDDIGGTEAF